MFQEYNDRLAELKTAERQRQNGLRQELELAEELNRRTRDRDLKAERLAKEQKDVDRLNGVSLGRLYYTLIGQKEAKLSREEEELLQAKMQHEEAVDTVADLESELAVLRSRLAKTRYIDSEIDALMREKESRIRIMHPQLAHELHALTEERTEAQADHKELNEAVSAGRSVLSSLQLALDKLDSARNWGTYDMLGGGLIATAIKHSRIDDARSAIHDAQTGLSRFQRELQDVERDVHVDIRVDGMLTFADYFFDGIFMDWIVQGRIKEAVEQVEQKHAQVHRIVSELETELGKAESRLSGLRRKETLLIENA